MSSNSKVISFVQIFCLYIAALRRVQELFDRAMQQAEEINRIAGKLDGVEDKLRDLLNNSRHSIDNSQAAIDLINRGEGKKQQITVR